MCRCGDVITADYAMTQDLVLATEDVALSVAPASLVGPPPPGPPGPPVPPDPPGTGDTGSFTDDFDRPDAGLVAPWLPARGSLTVAGGEIRNAPLKGSPLAVVETLLGGDQSASAAVASVVNNPGPRFGIVLRYQDANNYDVAYRRAGSISLLRPAKVVNGSEAMLASAWASNPSLNQFFRIGDRAALTAARLSLELDGAPLVSAVDGTFAGGRPGVFLSSGSSSTKLYRADTFSATVK